MEPCRCDSQVIEAAVENIPLKQQIFADLEKACGPQCILSSNTSTIDISLIGKKTQAADRILGAHFFSPAHIMPLLEVVRTSDTSKQVGGPSPNTPRSSPDSTSQTLVCS